MQDKINTSIRTTPPAKALLCEALLILLCREDFSRITVKALCEKAGVNRSTFYMYYNTKDELLSDAQEYLASETARALGGADFARGAPLERVLTEWLSFAASHRALFRAAAEGPNARIVRNMLGLILSDVLAPWLSRTGADENARYYMDVFCVSAVTSVTLEWIRGGCKEDAASVASQIMRCMPDLR